MENTFPKPLSASLLPQATKKKRNHRYARFYAPASRFCDEVYEIFILSCEFSENPKAEFGSVDLDAENGDPKLLFSVSVLNDSRWPIPISPSTREGNIRSVLGLPELTNDMSVSETESSPYGLFEFLPLRKGDLYQ